MMKITDLYFSKFTKTSKILENYDKIENEIYKIPKINPDKFHTKWPEISKNYGSLFSKFSEILAHT